MRIVCVECGADCTEEYLLCDRIDGTWCPYCFPKTCYAQHGEGCRTTVYQDRENRNETTAGLTDLPE